MSAYVRGSVQFFNGEFGLIKSLDKRLVHFTKSSTRCKDRGILRAGAEVTFWVRKGFGVSWNEETIESAHNVCIFKSALPSSSSGGLKRRPPTPSCAQKKPEPKQAPPRGERPASIQTRSPSSKKAPIYVKKKTLVERTACARSMLIKAGCPSSLDESGKEHLSLREAVKAQNTLCVFKHLSAGEDPNKRDENGSTLLTHAVLTNDSTLVDLLLIFGAHASLKNNNGVSALTLAFERHKYFHLRERLQTSERTGEPNQIPSSEKSPRLPQLGASSGFCGSSKSARDTSAKQNIEEARFAQEGSDSMDGSRGWGQAFRDGGSFGSCPGFDDYGDESFA